jgi:hypothetical protein
MFEDMDFHKERESLKRFHLQTSVLRSKLEQGKRTNLERQELQNKLTELNELKMSVDILQGVAGELLAETKGEDVAYKDRRLDFVSQKVTTDLERLFPLDSLKVKLKVDPTRGMKAHMALYDRHGIQRTASIYAGGMMKSTIAYSSSYSISESLGSAVMWMDEYFAASSNLSLAKMSEITKEALEQGVQIFMVEHKTAGYKNLPRREFHLERDLILNRVQKPVVRDFS